MEAASVIIAAIAVIVAVILHFLSDYKEKKVRTHNRINELFAANDDIGEKDLNKKFWEVVLYARKVDRFAVEYNCGLLDKKTVKDRAGKFLIRNYEEYFSVVIPHQRKQFKREDYFSDIENMIEELRK